MQKGVDKEGKGKPISTYKIVPVVVCSTWPSGYPER